MTSAGHHSMMQGAGMAPLTRFSLARDLRMAGRGFSASSLGSLPLSQTFTCWYKLTFEDRDIQSSKSIFKYGDEPSPKNGCGFGAGFIVGGYTRTSRAGLCDGKYWWSFETINSLRLPNTGWHHLAFRIKSGSSPLLNAVFIDGTVQTRASNSQARTGAYYQPTNVFSIGGRADEGVFFADLLVCHPRIYNEILDDAAIIADMAIPDKPSRQSLVHYWDGTLIGDKVQDLVGNWDLSFSTGCAIIPEAPEF